MLKPKDWLIGGVLGLALLYLANSCENAALRRTTLLAAQDSALRVQRRMLDSAVAVYRGADSVRFTARIAALERSAQRVRVVTVARVDTLRLALPDSLRPALDSIVAGFTTQLAAKDTAVALIGGRLAVAEKLLRVAQGNAHDWETQAGQWRKEATRWRLKLGPFTVRPCAGYGLTTSGASVFAGACLTP